MNNVSIYFVVSAYGNFNIFMKSKYESWHYELNLKFLK